MSSWNCRVIHYSGKDGDFGVHEVYYDDAGAINGWTDAPSLALIAERPELIREQVLAMLDDALALPVLEERSMPGYVPVVVPHV